MTYSMTRSDLMASLRAKPDDAIVGFIHLGSACWVANALREKYALLPPKSVSVGTQAAFITVDGRFERRELIELDAEVSSLITFFDLLELDAPQSLEEGGDGFRFIRAAALRHMLVYRGLAAWDEVGRTAEELERKEGTNEIHAYARRPLALAGSEAR